MRSVVPAKRRSVVRSPKSAKTSYETELLAASINAKYFKSREKAAIQQLITRNKRENEL